MTKETVEQPFLNYFRIKKADTPQLLDTVYSIRFRVYCQEFRYEKEEDCPGGKEQDEYDSQSQHCLLIHNSSGLPAGCVRLVFPEDTSGRPLPFERYCSEAFDQSVFDFKSLPPGSYGEFSRLAVPDYFRRRQNDEHAPVSLTGKDLQASSEHPRFPFIPVSLFLSAVLMLHRSELDYAFAMMEPKLVRLLRRFGIIFQQAGRVIDYHGPRGLFVLPRQGMMDKLSPDIRDLMHAIDKMLAGQEHERNEKSHRA